MTCSSLLTTSSSTWPESALFQISANGIPLDKLLIGKPAESSDATNGYMDATTLASCVAQAHASGWSEFDTLHVDGQEIEDFFAGGGVMVWKVRCGLSVLRNHL